MSTRKRKRKAQKKQTPLLPPDVAEDDVYVSEEDLSFVAKHRKYAGFLSNLDTSTITKQVLGIKSKKEGDTLESYYEKKAKQIPATKERGTTVDPIDVLPVKTLSGELHYRNAKSKSQLEQEGNEGAQLSLEQRKALVRTKAPTDALQQVGSKVGVADNHAADAEGKKKPSKSELRKERKKAKKEREALANGRSTMDEKGSTSHISALEELKQDLSEEERVEEMKARMAELGTAVLGDPEGNIESLVELQGLCLDKDVNVAGMAMLSSLAVFKDIIPGYRIRLPTQKELEMQVSKEVKKLRDFETKLLKCYQKYVQVLIKSVKSKALARPAIRCVCGLVEAVPHFNFREALLNVTIPFLDSADSDCRKLGYDAMRNLFLSEGKHGGSATVEAVEMIADLVKTENCVVQPDAVKVLSLLPFDEELNKPAPANETHKGNDARVEKLKSKQDKKAKKRQLAEQLRDEVAADFQESSALPDASERRRLQTQTLTAVFETYFRILKASLAPVVEDTDSAARRRKRAECGPHPLLRPCLDGLAKFSHLVSVDFMGDLLGVLKSLSAGISPQPAQDLGREPQSEAPLSWTDRLHCCVAAFKIVRSNLDALNIDLREFYISLYNLLLSHTNIRDEEESVVLAEALQVMLWESRQHDMQRVAAFVKQLAAMSLHLGPAEAMSALVTVRHLLQRYKKCCILLENEEGGVVAGNLAVLQSEGADPDLSGALSAVLWEVSLLSRHYHPAIAKLATHISNMLTSTDTLQASLTAKEALLVYSTSKGGFNPSVQLPKKRVRKKAYVSQHGVSTKPQMAWDDGLDSLSTAKTSSKLFSSYFKVLKDIKENEMLRKELSRTMRSCSLFKEFRAQKRQT